MPVTSINSSFKLLIILLVTTLTACTKSDSNSSTAQQQSPVSPPQQQTAVPTLTSSADAIEGTLAFVEGPNIYLLNNMGLYIKDENIKKEISEIGVGKKIKLDGKPIGCKEVGLSDDPSLKCFEVSSLFKDQKDVAKQKVMALLERSGADLNEFKKQPDFEAKIMEYYNDVTTANSKLPQDLGENDIKAKVASLNDKQSKLYRDAASNIDVKIQEKSSKTLISGQYKTAVVLRNSKDTGFFSNNYEIKKVDLFLKLKDPIFGMPVHFEKLTFSGIEPGETKTIEITSRFGGLEIIEKSLYLRKVDKKGITYDSNVFNF